MATTARLKAASLILLGSAALAACAKKPPEQLPPEPGPAHSDNTGNQTGAPIPGSQADFAAQMRGQDTIYFDTDRYNIDSADAAALQTQAQWLGRYPNKQATIEGHADERGTRDYKNYLVSLGVSASRLNTVSYGKERPVALGSDEQSWARNRRAVTVTID
jgi:peptidoglycan-associated lipoprotein